MTDPMQPLAAALVEEDHSRMDDEGDPFAGAGYVTCPNDSVRLVEAGSLRNAYLQCPVCGLIRIFE